MNESDASVSQWLEDVKRGDERAAAQLYERYFRRLAGLARQRLGAARARLTSDEEDVAQSAFHDFCRAARTDHYAQLADRDGLWRVLVAFVRNKVSTYQDREEAAKRGGLLQRQGADDSTAGPLDRVTSREPDPALEAELDDLFGHALARLQEREAEVVALRLQGHSTEEIAARVGLSRATVGRLLQTAREVLAQEFGISPEST